MVSVHVQRARFSFRRQAVSAASLAFSYISYLLQKKKTPVKSLLRLKVGESEKTADQLAKSHLKTFRYAAMAPNLQSDGEIVRLLVTARVRHASVSFYLCLLLCRVSLSTTRTRSKTRRTRKTMRRRYCLCALSFIDLEMLRALNQH